MYSWQSCHYMSVFFAYSSADLYLFVSVNEQHYHCQGTNVFTNVHPFVCLFACLLAICS